MGRFREGCVWWEIGEVEGFLEIVYDFRFFFLVCFEFRVEEVREVLMV